MVRTPRGALEMLQDVLQDARMLDYFFALCS